MSTEIERTIQIDDKTVHIHIHLTEVEIQRLLLPHISSIYAREAAYRGYEPRITCGNAMVHYERIESSTGGQTRI